MIQAGRIADAKALETFVREGRAVFSLLSLRTGTWYTYRTRKLFGGLSVELLVGPDNSNHYMYLGYMPYAHQAQLTFQPGRLAKAPAAKAFDWTWRCVSKGELHKDLEVWHAGHCGKCGRQLTTPESLAVGLGPICAQRS